MSWRDRFRTALAGDALQIPLFHRKPAAVVVPLLELAGAPALLLTRRATTLTAHPGEISFPGGKVEPGDPSSYAAALREAAEELGLDPRTATPLGQLNDAVTTTGFRVRPHVVCFPGQGRRLRPQPGEVQQVLVLPLEDFGRPSRGFGLSDPGGGVQHRLLLYNHQGNIIWGATARIIDELVQRVMPQPEPPRHRHPADLCPTRQAILGRLLDARRVILTTHINPDPDGLGCQVALEQLLGELGVEVLVANAHATPARFDFLQPRHQLPREQITADLARGADLLLVLDTADTGRLGVARELLAPMAGRVAVLDHHQVGDIGGELCFRDASFASTAQIVYGLLARLGYPFCQRSAEALYAALMFDTGSFRYLGGSTEPHRVAAQLQQLGADATAVQQALYGRTSMRHARAMALAVERLQLECDGQWAWICLDAGVLGQQGPDALRYEDTGEIAPFLLSLQGVQVATLVRDEGDGTVRLSFRSRRGFGVGPLAAALGGGGHENAAGATVSGPLEPVLAKVREMVQRVIQRGGQEAQ